MESAETVGAEGKGIGEERVRKEVGGRGAFYSGVLVKYKTSMFFPFYAS